MSRKGCCPDEIGKRECCLDDMCGKDCSPEESASRIYETQGMNKGSLFSMKPKITGGTSKWFCPEFKDLGSGYRLRLPASHLNG